MDQEKMNLLPEELTTEQCVYFNMLSVEAIVNVLMKKGVCSHEDIIESLKEVKKQQDYFVTNLANQEKNKE